MVNPPFLKLMNKFKPTGLISVLSREVFSEIKVGAGDMHMRARIIRMYAWKLFLITVLANMAGVVAALPDVKWKQRVSCVVRREDIGAPILPVLTSLYISRTCSVFPCCRKA